MDTQIKGRRRVLAASAAALASTSLLGFPALVRAQSKGPLKLGMLDSFTKSFSGLGKEHLQGFNLYLESVNGEFGGRKVELIREDDEINPQVGLQKMRKLVDGDKCELVMGVQNSGTLMALVDYLRQSKAMFVSTGAAATAASYVKVPSFFRTSTSSWQSNAAMGGWFYDNVAKEVVLTASDFAGGRDAMVEFKRTFTRKGGKIIKEIYPPLGTNDFSSYLADLRSIAPPATYNFYAGTDAVRFVKQCAEVGLNTRTKIGCSGFMCEQDVLPAQGDAALGILSSMHYSDAIDNPENKKFVAEYLAKYKQLPSVYAEYSYTGARFVDEMLKLTNGDTCERRGDAIGAAQGQVQRAPAARSPSTPRPTTPCKTSTPAKSPRSTAA